MIRRVEGDYASSTPAICQLDGAQTLDGTPRTITVKLPGSTLAAYTRTTGNPTLGFSTSGTFVIRESASKVAKVTYTGSTATTLTGCTVTLGTTGSYATDSYVSRLSLLGTTIGLIHSSVFTDQGGFQGRAAQIGFELREDGWYNGFGYATAGAINAATSDLSGTDTGSQRVEHVSLNEEGYIGLDGSSKPTHLEEQGLANAADFKLHIGGHFTRVEGAQTFPLTGNRLLTRYTAGWPTTGMDVKIGGVAGYTYTGRDGAYLTGCTGPAGAVADDAAIEPDDTAIYVSVYADGRITARGGRASRATIGNVGPTAADPEAGLLLGSAGDASIYRVAADVLGVDDTFEFTERSDPSAPAANKARLYSKDNGAGKTQLVARFPTGAVQVIATEP